MQINRLIYRDIGSHAGKRDVDFDNLFDARLIAITGGNGAGKTSFIENILGGLFLETPSRGRIQDLVKARDSFLEVFFTVNDIKYQTKILINGVSKTKSTEAYLYREGEPVNDGKISTFKKSVSEVLPSKDLILSSVFAHQGGKGRFIGLSTVERKKLFIDMLGLDSLQTLSDRASERSKEIEKQIDRINAQIEFSDVTNADYDKAKQLLKVNSKLLNDYKSIFEKARKEFETNQTARSFIEKQIKEKYNELNSLQLDLGSHNEKQKTLERDQQNLLNKLSSIKSEGELIKAQINDDLNYDLIKGLIDDTKDLLDTKQNAVKELQQRLENLRFESNQKTESLRSSIDEKKTELTVVDQRLRDLNLTIDQGNKASSFTAHLPCAIQGNINQRECPLIRDQVENKNKASKAIKEKPAVVGKIELIKDHIDTLDKELMSYVVTTDDQIKKLQDEVSCSYSEIEDMTKTLSSYQDQYAISIANEDNKNKLAQLRSEYKDVNQILSELNCNVLQCNDDIEKLTFAKNKVEKEIINFETKLNDKSIEEKFNTVKEKNLELKTTLSQAEIEFARIKKEYQKIKIMKQSLNNLRQSLIEWDYLKNAFGRNGIQALEIDAAGPDVSEIANTLLSECYGNRFCVDLVTTRLKKDGKGTKEIFDLSVIDYDTGYEGPASHLSGGEQVLVYEALALAIAVFNARKSNVPLRDLFRDECSGALTKDNSIRYIAMLRRALDLGGFDKCYFIAHQEWLHELADGEIKVTRDAIDY